MVPPEFRREALQVGDRLRWIAAGSALFLFVFGSATAISFGRIRKETYTPP